MNEHLHTISNEELRPSYTTKIFSGGTEFCEKNIGAFVEIFTAASKAFINEKDLPVDLDQLKEDLEDPDTFGVILTQENKLIGFSYAHPDNEKGLNPFSFHKIAQFDWTMIHPDHQKKGGWKKIMDTMDNHLVKKGYTVMRRFVNKNTDHADMIAARYGEDVLNITTSRTQKELLILIPQNLPPK